LTDANKVIFKPFETTLTEECSHCSMQMLDYIFLICPANDGPKEGKDSKKSEVLGKSI
jgi:hypothetical protein